MNRYFLTGLLSALVSAGLACSALAVVAAEPPAPVAAAQAVSGNLRDSVVNHEGEPTPALAAGLVAPENPTVEAQLLPLLGMLSLLNPAVGPDAQFSATGNSAAVTYQPPPLKLIMAKNAQGQWQLDLQATYAGLPAATREALAKMDSASTATVSVVTDATFKAQVLDNPGWVLVDFGATWCGWCTKLKPVLDQVAQDYAGKLKIVSMDVDDSPTIPRQFSVQGLPTLILYHNGQMKNRTEGYREAPALKAWLDATMAG